MKLKTAKRESHDQEEAPPGRLSASVGGETIGTVSVSCGHRAERLALFRKVAVSGDSLKMQFCVWGPEPSSASQETILYSRGI